MRRLVAIVLVVLLSLALVPLTISAAWAAEGEDYRVRTDDGASLGIKRYRPEPGAAFNDDAQPVIFMPGAIANFNEFDVRTPEGKDYHVDLPDGLPLWAQDDQYIENDPLKFYSMAYYLYDHGYDVWLANYRGQGRWPNRSFGRWNANLDIFGVYDVQAVVKKVREVTGRKPVYIGHSMGCTMAYVYLQGSVFGRGFNPHVVSNPVQVAERNDGEGPGAIKGLVDLDGPIIPAADISVPGIAWLILLPPIYFNLRPVSKLVGEGAAEPLLFLEEILWAIRHYLPDELEEILALLYFIKPDNMEIDVLKYLAGYALDGIHSHASAQFADGLNNHRLREYYRNGFLGRFRIIPPVPRPGDGYYYYTDNMDKISLPSLVIADSTVDLTDPEDIESFYLSKTRHPLDEFHVIPETAHVDLVMGISAPYDTYPVIGNWLQQLCDD